MGVPALFTARGGVVLFRMRPVPDWTVQEVKRAINREGLDAQFGSRAFDVWTEAADQLRDAQVHAQNQRRHTDNPPPRAA